MTQPRPHFTMRVVLACWAVGLEWLLLSSKQANAYSGCSIYDDDFPDQKELEPEKGRQIADGRKLTARMP